MIITIDGPSGTGKTTTAQDVAKRIGFTYLDTGAMYRSFAWYLFDLDLPIQEEAISPDVLNGFDYQVEEEGDSRRYFVGGQEVSEEIRSPEITKASSEVAKFVAVRHHIVAMQREYAHGKDVVMEGRDIGTVVFPHAELKIFLEAGAWVRAQRRYAQMCAKYPERAQETSIEEILSQQSIRDANDSSRELSPLQCPEDAIKIDTTHMTIASVVEKISTLAHQLREKPKWLRQGVYWFFRAIANFTLRAMYRIESHGQENVVDGAAILAANHVSFLDPPIISFTCPKILHFLARGSLFKYRIFGKLISLLNSHPITGGVQDVSLFHVVEKLILQGNKVVMFPEGRRSRDGKIHHFKRGLGWIVERTGAVVVPVYIDGAFEAWPRRNKLPRPFKKITCVYGEPLHFQRPSGISEKEYQHSIVKDCEEAVRALETWVKQGKKGPLPKKAT